MRKQTKLFETKMSGNVYNKIDAETWMTVPKFSEARATSFLDVTDLVLFDEELLNNYGEVKKQNVDVKTLFDET